MVMNLPVNVGEARDSGSISGWEDPLEKERATRSSILAWRIPWTGETGGLQSMGSERVQHDWATFTFTRYITTAFTLTTRHAVL